MGQTTVSEGAIVSFMVGAGDIVGEGLGAVVGFIDGYSVGSGVILVGEGVTEWKNMCKTGVADQSNRLLRLNYYQTYQLASSWGQVLASKLVTVTVELWEGLSEQMWALPLEIPLEQL